MNVAFIHSLAMRAAMRTASGHGETEIAEIDATEPAKAADATKDTEELPRPSANSTHPSAPVEANSQQSSLENACTARFEACLVLSRNAIHNSI